MSGTIYCVKGNTMYKTYTIISKYFFQKVYWNQNCLCPYKIIISSCTHIFSIAFSLPIHRNTYTMTYPRNQSRSNNEPHCALHIF